MPTSKIVNSINAIFFFINCSSLPCTLSLYNTFRCTVSVKAGQKRTEARRTKEQRNTGRTTRTHYVDFLNVLIDSIYLAPLHDTRNVSLIDAHSRSEYWK